MVSAFLLALSGRGTMGMLSGPILKFVADVSNEKSKDYVEPAERIAVFLALDYCRHEEGLEADLSIEVNM
jgi:hypothetical protein